MSRESGWSATDRALGLDRPITRRDFLQGAAFGAAWLAGVRGRSEGSVLAAATGEAVSGSGLDGQDLAATALGHRLRDGEFAATLPKPHDTGESYDLVVVGAGLAGLTAAYVVAREMQGRARILILDNHTAFGGHARRNTFHHAGTTLVAQGGCFALEEPEHSPPEARQILGELGVDAAALEALRDAGFKQRYGLSQGVFFDPRVWPGTRPAWVTGFYTRPYDAFFAEAPLEPAVRHELVTLYTTRRDYLPGLRGEARERALRAVSWERFLRDTMGLGDAAARFANLYATDLVGLGCDAVSALAGYEIGPGFAGMEGPGFAERNGILAYAYEPTARFPDGNYTLARLLVKRLVPQALSGGSSLEQVFLADELPEAFDRPESPVRLRLGALAVRLAHEGPDTRPTGLTLDYARAEGGLARVRARAAIVTAWGLAAKHVVPELPAEQRAALDAYRYASCLYVNVLLRHWRFAAEAGVFDMFFPGGWATWGHIGDPLALGRYRPEYRPERPTVLSLYRYLHKPGLPVDDQLLQSRVELEGTSFETLEREIRQELVQLFGPWGFDPREDVLAITVNRWGHGYCFFDAPGGRPEGERPFERGRARLGRISFAGADAAGTPWTQAAMVQAHRAAFEQLAVIAG